MLVNFHVNALQFYCQKIIGTCPKITNTKQNCRDIMIEKISNVINLLCSLTLKETHKEYQSDTGKSADKTAKKILAPVKSPNFRKNLLT